MRKMFVSLFLCLFLVNVSAIAQVKFGIKWGINMGTFSYDKDRDCSTDAKVGFTLGPVVKFSLPVTGFGIDIAALYDFRSVGVKSEDLMGGKMYTTTIKQHQIAIPLNLRYDFNLAVMDLCVFAGPQLGVLLDKKEVKLDYGVWSPESTNFSVNVGVGTVFKKQWQIALEYNIVCGKNAELYINDNKVVNNGKINALQLSLGYFF